MMQKPWIALLLAIAIAAVGGVFLLRGRETGTANVAIAPEPPRPYVGRAAASEATEVGMGWGQGLDGTTAARDALTRARAKMTRPPQALIVFVSADVPSAPGALALAISQIRKELGNDVRIYGGTSDPRGVLTAERLLQPSDEVAAVVSVMAIASDEITFGVGSATFAGSSSITDAAEMAVKSAMKDARRPAGEKPKAILVATTATNTGQSDILLGLERVIGREMPVLGGRVGAAIAGPSHSAEGLSVAAIYTDLPVGSTFEGGYDVSSPKSGVITRIENGTRLLEIDGRPALDVYDDWLGGEVRRLYRTHPKQTADDLLALHPIYTRQRSARGEVYSIFAHVWPADASLTDKTLEIGTRMHEGERLHLASGNWETLLNRITNLPLSARRRGGLESTQPILGFGWVCAGVFAVVPPAERPKAPLLISQNHEGAPFVAAVSWGEYGYLPGVGNRYGNLLTSFLVIGPRSAD